MQEDLDIKEYTDPRHNPMILYYVAGSGQQPCRIGENSANQRGGVMK